MQAEAVVRFALQKSRRQSNGGARIGSHRIFKANVKLIKSTPINGGEVRLESHEDYWIVRCVGVPKPGKKLHIAWSREDADRRYEDWIRFGRTLWS